MRDEYEEQYCDSRCTVRHIQRPTQEGGKPYAIELIKITCRNGKLSFKLNNACIPVLYHIINSEESAIPRATIKGVPAGSCSSSDARNFVDASWN